MGFRSSIIHIFLVISVKETNPSVKLFRVLGILCCLVYVLFLLTVISCREVLKLNDAFC